MHPESTKVITIHQRENLKIHDSIPSTLIHSTYDNVEGEGSVLERERERAR